MTGQGIIAAGITIGGFKWTGNFTTIDLIAATTWARASSPARPTPSKSRAATEAE